MEITRTGLIGRHVQSPVERARGLVREHARTLIPRLEEIVVKISEMILTPKFASRARVQVRKITLVDPFKILLTPFGTLVDPLRLFF